jgi:hypothetical protein
MGNNWSILLSGIPSIVESVWGGQQTKSIYSGLNTSLAQQMQAILPVLAVLLLLRRK